MRVHSIYPAIQGEGCQAGMPMILIRLQGCNLRCSFCDTKETWDPNGGRELSIPVIMEQVGQATQGHKWVLLTGGEPLVQDVTALVDALHGSGYQVALETNGTQPIPKGFDWVCMSPKGDIEIPTEADEVKYIVKDKLPSVVPEGPVICLQPESQDPIATALCIKAVQERGWRLSIQLHKYLNLP